jgi:hypothetical protein
MFAITQKDPLSVKPAQAGPDFIQATWFPTEGPGTMVPGVIGETAQQGPSRSAGRFQKQNHLRQLFHNSNTSLQETTFLQPFDKTHMNPPDLTQVRNERKETDFFREGLRHNPLRGRGWCVAEAM